MPAKQPPLNLKDAVAVVSGAGGGIGGAIALSLARRGCHLALTDFRADALTQTARAARSCGVKVSEHVFDISNPESVAIFPAAVAAEHGQLTVLVNCAGVALAGTFEQVSLAEFEWLMQINFWSVVRMMKAFLPLLERQPEAQIVNISSIFGLVGPPGQSAYAASKFAIRGVSESLRHELDLAGKHIGVTLVHPAGVLTNIVKNTRIAAAMPKEEVDIPAWEKMLPASPATVAESIVAGLQRRKKRIMCGPQAGTVDFLQRLLPVKYWNVFQLQKPPGSKAKLSN